MDIHVELLGIPGAGKTSATPVVLDELRAGGIEAFDSTQAIVAAARLDERDRATRGVVRRLPSRWSRRFVERSHHPFLGISDVLLRYPDWGVTVIEILKTRESSEPERDRVLAWTLSVGWQYALAQRYPGGCLVLDEGFAHRAVTLLGFQFGRDETDHDLLRKYTAAIPPPSLVVHVAADPEAVHDRAGVPERFRFLDSEAQLRYLRDAEECVRETSSLLSTRGVDVCLVENDGTLDSMRAGAASAVGSWLSRRTAGR